MSHRRDDAIMFSLDYAPDIDPVTLERLEQVGRDVGLSLGQIELLGQSQELAVDFISSAVHGDLDGFMTAVDWHRLEDLLERRLMQT